MSQKMSEMDKVYWDGFKWGFIVGAGLITLITAVVFINTYPVILQRGLAQLGIKNILGGLKT